MADDKGHGGGGGAAPGSHGGGKDDHGHGKKHKKHGGGHHGGHHEEGVPEWMVSFADNVCLMMGFFVIMLALNMKPAQGGSGEDKKDGDAASAATASSINPGLVDAAIAIRSAFNNPVNENSKKPEDQPLIARIKEKRTGVGKSREEAPMGDSDSVSSVRPSDYYSLGGVVPFIDNSAEITATSRRLIADVAQHLNGPRFMIEVRGHVSAMEAEQNVANAMKLSHQRAFAVAEALAAEGLPWARLRVVACADHERVSPIAYDLKSHRSNQRVEVLVTKETMPEDPHLREQSPPEAAPPASPDAFARPQPKGKNDGHGGGGHGEAKKDEKADAHGAEKKDDKKPAKKEEKKDAGGHH